MIHAMFIKTVGKGLRKGAKYTGLGISAAIKFGKNAQAKHQHSFVLKYLAKFMADADISQAQRNQIHESRSIIKEHCINCE